MRTSWRDGDRTREVEIAPLGGERYRITVDGAAFEALATRLEDGRLSLELPEGRFLAEVSASGDRRFVRVGTLDFVLSLEPAGRRRARAAAGGSLEAPMPGVVTRVMVAKGDQVEAGQPLVALEAMKMEHLVRAPRAGRVRAVGAVVGQMVAGGVTLIELERDEKVAD
jgi:3-methylcrotonyl-CoA carboxylase alpha subunit